MVVKDEGERRSAYNLQMWSITISMCMFLLYAVAASTTTTTTTTTTSTTI